MNAANKLKVTSTPPAKKVTAAKHKIGREGGSGSGALMTILNTVASMKVILNQDGVERKKLAFLTKINGKSTIANALTKLKSQGWIDVTPTTVSITDEGLKHVDQEELEKARASIPTTNEDHWETVKERFNLKTTKLALLQRYYDTGV